MQESRGRNQEPLKLPLGPEYFTHVHAVPVNSGFMINRQGYIV